jgi:hypothetical protein
VLGKGLGLVDALLADDLAKALREDGQVMVYVRHVGRCSLR